MNLNFEQPIERRNTQSYKWDQCDKLFGDKEILPLWVADMDFTAPSAVIEALKARVEHGIYGYTIREESYYKAITSWVERRHHWSIKQEWITTSPGVVTALSILVNLLTEPHDKIIIQTPVYPPFHQVIRGNDRIIVENPLQLKDHHYTMDFDLLEQAMKDPDVKLMILCNPHNPVGRVWKKEELQKIGEWSLKYGVFVISDEIHCDLIYRGHQHIPYASLSDEIANYSITCFAPTKTFNIAGIQSSTILIPDAELRKKYNDRLSTLSLQFDNCFSVVATEAAYNHGEEWLNGLIDYLHHNLEYVMGYFNEYLPEISVIKPEGTYLVWLDCRKLGLTGEQLKDFMYKQAKIALNEGSTFGSNGEGFLRLNIACPKETLTEGLERLRRALEKLE
ncbi:MalY/PatB family protein [Ammoniphilus sp. CFH 90114]|uniref:MalY/PatB family protein n=1 Tax=Ammoniphilus sp. CFH 90114 TaxID=2493665 RepID=UPI00100F222B|nr:MalY/PatB family protein [Ammoniphilus sp. CFH 90114]RXT06266.1 pyridoxal phosphate-dependent aminotransferase [Ammoniphilus sp. CFH 90114]